MSGAARYSIQLIKVGQADVRGPEAFWMSHWDEWVTLVFYVVLIQSPELTLLVNTGPPPDLSDINRVWAGYQDDSRAALRVEADERMPGALEAHGVSPDEVDVVLISPFSAYATGNLDLFARAQIALSRVSWMSFIAPAPGADPTAERSTCIPMAHLSRLVTDWWPRVRLLADEDSLAPGLTVFRTGVHDRGSVALRIETAIGTVVWSDSAYVRGNLEQRHPMGIARDLDEAYASYERIAAEADLFLPGFEPSLLTEHPGGRVA